MLRQIVLYTLFLIHGVFFLTLSLQFSPELLVVLLLVEYRSIPNCFVPDHSLASSLLFYYSIQVHSVLTY